MNAVLKIVCDETVLPSSIWENRYWLQSWQPTITFYNFLWEEREDDFGQIVAETGILLCLRGRHRSPPASSLINVFILMAVF